MPEHVHPLYTFYRQAAHEANKASQRLAQLRTKGTATQHAKALQLWRRLDDAAERALRDWEEWCERQPAATE